MSTRIRADGTRVPDRVLLRIDVAEDGAVRDVAPLRYLDADARTIRLRTELAGMATLEQIQDHLRDVYGQQFQLVQL